MRRRTASREAALQYLYRCELTKTTQFSAEHLRDFLKHFKIPQGDLEYTENLVRRVLIDRDSLDEKISARTHNWKLDRILTVDHIALRIGIYEMFGSEDVPYKVAINEAVDLAKRYSVANSGGFVNGILDAIGKENGLQ